MFHISTTTILLTIVLNTIVINMESSPGTELQIRLIPGSFEVEMGEGETLKIDCEATYVQRDEDSLELWWQGPATSITERMVIENSTKKHNNDTVFRSAFMLSNLRKTDAGNYTCNVHHGNLTYTRITVVNVFDKGRLCHFEKSDLCGWYMNKTGDDDVTWHWHSVKDDDMHLAPFSDHTYGSPKSKGHFLDIQLPRVEANNDPNTMMTTNRALVTSPVFKTHDKQRCFQFWYIFTANDSGNDTHHDYHFHIKLMEVNSNSVSRDLGFIEAGKQDNWQFGAVDIPLVDNEYQILLAAMTCSRECGGANIAVDDIKISEGQCEHPTLQGYVDDPLATTKKPSAPPSSTVIPSSSSTNMPTSTASTVDTTKPSSTTLLVTTLPSTTPTTIIDHSSTVIPTSTKKTTKISPTTKQSPTSSSAKATSTEEPQDVVTDKDSRSPHSRTGVILGIIVFVSLGVLVIFVIIFRTKKRNRKSKYLNFGNPISYSREHLPTNDFNMDSPLNVGSSGYTVLA